MAKIELYGTRICPYCVRAKALLDKKGAAYTEYKIDEDPAAHAALKERAPGARTVPQIFIDDRHIGGCDDLMALDKAGGLDPLLAGAAP